MNNTVDIKVGSFIRQWVIGTYGSDTIRLDKRTNLWAIVKQNLDLLPADYHTLQDKEEYISIELLYSHTDNCYSIPAGKEIHINSIYRCYISDSGQEAIKRYLENQFRAAFRIYMVACNRNDQKVKILNCITSFLLDYNLPIDNKLLSRLMKDWYRYRQKNSENNALPIFF